MELAKAISFILCILALYAVFHAAFLDPANDLQQRICNALARLALAAGISLASGLIFREAIPGRGADTTRLAATLPLQMFRWASGIMLILFLVSWYLEGHCVFYRDVRY